MAEPIDVLVVEDSPLFVEAIRTVLESDQALRVVGVAANGREALELTHRLKPKVITMDVHMPVMGGLEAIERIMADCPTPILVVTSDPRAIPGDELHFDALRRGALDVITKPSQWPGEPQHQEALRNKIKLLSRVAVVRHLAGHRHRWVGGVNKSSVAVHKDNERRNKEANRPLWTSTSEHEKSTKDASFGRRLNIVERRFGEGVIVGIVASTGGPAAIARIFELLPSDFQAPIVVTQHISAGFAASLASWLNEVTPLVVSLAKQDALLSPGRVYIAPDDEHLTVTPSGHCALHQSPPVQGHRPSGTILLSSLARSYGRRAIGVILTGMGDDGVAGLEELQQAGGITLAQDEASSVIFGMPRVALERGAAQQAVPLLELPETLCKLVGVPHTVSMERR